MPVSATHRKPKPRLIARYSFVTNGLMPLIVRRGCECDVKQRRARRGDFPLSPQGERDWRGVRRDLASPGPDPKGGRSPFSTLAATKCSAFITPTDPSQPLTCPQ